LNVNRIVRERRFLLKEITLNFLAHLKGIALRKGGFDISRDTLHFSLEEPMEKTCIVCPLTGFNIYFNKKFIIGALITVVWFNVFASIWHGMVMAEAYSATSTLWRNPSEMDPLLLNGGLSVLAFFASYIFMKGYSGTGIREGIRFGIIMTLLFLGLGLVTNATQPIPWSIIQMWVLGDLIQYSVGGILLALYFGRNT